MDNYFYYYKIKFFDEVECVEKEVDGITFGDTCADVVHNIASFYGDSNIIDIMHCFVLGDGGSCVELEDCNKIFEQVNSDEKETETD